MSFKTGDGRPLILYCHGPGNCAPEDVLESCGRTWADFDDTPRSAKKVSTMNREKNLSPANPTVGTRFRGAVITKVYDYHDENGNVVFRACRTANKDFPIARPDSRSRTDWYWGRDHVDTVLYGLPAVLEAVEAGRTIYIVEGEKDADAINEHDPDSTGYVATTAPLGARKWRSEYADALDGAAHVVVWADRDKAGTDHAKLILESLQGRAGNLEAVQAKEGKDASDHLSTGHGLNDVVPIELGIDDHPPADADRTDSWGPPIPFRSHKLPEFPVNSLPSPLLEFVKAESLATQTPMDLAGCLVLAACSVAIGRRFRVEVRPGWEEPTNLFVVVVLDPGNRKTAVVADVTRPITEFEKSEWERLAPEITDARTRHEIHKKRYQQAQKEAAKAEPPDRDRLERQAIEAANNLESLRVPPHPRIFADDVTPEKLAQLISDYDGQFAVLSAEGGIFESMAGRYSPNNAPNFDVFLKGHAGDPLRVDRVNRPPDSVDNPCLTVSLAVQNDVLRGLASKPGFRGRGLLARFLYAIPESSIGRRMIGAPSVPMPIRLAYEQRITAILQMEPATDNYGKPTARTIRFDPDAADRFRAFEKQIEPELAPFGELGSIQDWGSKHVGSVARLCGIIHVVKLADEPSLPDTRRIDLATVNEAIEIGGYFRAHARGAFAEMGADPEVENARHVVAWISRKDRQSFTVRDAYQDLKGRFSRVADLQPALKLLVEHEYIREQHEEGRKGRGRPRSPGYDVNPIFGDIGNIGDRNRTAISDLPSSSGTSDGTKTTFDSHPHNPQYPQNSSDDDDRGEAA
ncbi:MAG: DUF3987 domain-containing protein [bacterium]|nr:DUF3987 domain-containing protein [bacterium]